VILPSSAETNGAYFVAAAWTLLAVLVAGVLGGLLRGWLR
jgi:hypothetical protein